jgi:hypothetical protein
MNDLIGLFTIQPLNIDIDGFISAPCHNHFANLIAIIWEEKNESAKNEKLR